MLCSNIGPNQMVIQVADCTVTLKLHPYYASCLCNIPANCGTNALLQLIKTDCHPRDFPANLPPTASPSNYPFSPTGNYLPK